MNSGTARLDRNKTKLTHDVTAAVCRWLDGHGFKPVETEVWVAEAWVADVAAVIVPTQTELQDLKLVRRKPKWRRDNQEQRDAWYAIARAMPPLMTALVEVKTSVSDFRGDKKWTRVPPATLTYVAIPADLAIRLDELPQGWGVLEYRGDELCVRQSAIPVIRETTAVAQLGMIYEIAIRRDHRTRYETQRECRREIVDRQNESISRTRVATAIRAMIAVVSGSSLNGRIQHASVEEALEYHGIKHVSAFDRESLGRLWKVAEQAHAEFLPQRTQRKKGSE